MVFYATFNNISVISWRSVLLVEETRVHGENHGPVTSHRQSLSHNIVSSTPRHERFRSRPRWPYLSRKQRARLFKQNLNITKLMFCVPYIRHTFFTLRTEGYVCITPEYDQ